MVVIKCIFKKCPEDYTCLAPDFNLGKRNFNPVEMPITNFNPGPGTMEIPIMCIIRVIQKKPRNMRGFLNCCDLTENRTPVAEMKTRCPSR